MTTSLSAFLALWWSIAAAWASANLDDQYFDSNGVRIRYLDHGAGEPVVLVHGYLSRIEHNWMNTGVLQDLSRDHRVIALDCRGHGKSDRPHDPKQYGAEMAHQGVLF